MIKNLHPLTLFVYFFYVIFVSVFTFNPLFLAASLFGAVLLLIATDGVKSVKMLIVYLILIIVISLSNPLFSHNGATVLFFINDSRITLEALIYGITSSTMIAATLVWFNCFNKIFDSEKLMYLIGRFFPKLALVFSMTLNFIPRLISEFKSINNSQKVIKQSRIKRYLGAFSAVITRSMEGAVITSDSMNARGYRIKGRTFFHRYKFTVTDFVYLIIFTALFALSLIWQCEFSFYPYFEITLNAHSATSVMAFTVLAVLPFVLELKEVIKWKFYLSKI